MEQDADLAQARVFLELLTVRAQTLARELGFAHRGDAAARQELHVELCTVRRYIIGCTADSRKSPRRNTIGR
ncbi:hypothetical protein [Nocardia asiatica]|uniref:hypothetical protein n=1 Tax=Nocardia asiatica TaxID=209252 RepID=UPI003EE0EA32